MNAILQLQSLRAIQIWFYGTIGPMVLCIHMLHVFQSISIAMFLFNCHGMIGPQYILLLIFINLIRVLYLVIDLVGNNSYFLQLLNLYPKIFVTRYEPLLCFHRLTGMIIYIPHSRLHKNNTSDWHLNGTCTWNITVWYYI